MSEMKVTTKRKPRERIMKDKSQPSNTKTNQQITVKEFKMWINGILEMQDDGWTPDLRQWTKILNKIGDIADTVDQHPVQLNGYATPSTFEPLDSAIPKTNLDSHITQAPSGLQTVIPNYTTPQSTSLSGPFAGDSSNVPVKTPHIDSTGGYSTPFE